MSAKAVLPSYSMNRAGFPWLYERSLVAPLFRPWADLLLDRAELRPGDSLIDVACGTGIVARAGRERGAQRIVGVDSSAPMLDVAREIEPSIEWREGDAARLPVGSDERFDWAFCQQGLQFFTDRAGAAAELRRVVQPGGGVLVAVWRSTQEMPPFEALQRVAEQHVGAIADQRYGFGAAAALERLLVDAGFAEVRTDPVSMQMRFPDGAHFLRMNGMALLGMSGVDLSEGKQETLLDEIVRESMEAARSFFEGPALVCQMSANIAVARNR